MNELTVVTGSALIEAFHSGSPIAVPKRREIFLKTVNIAGWIYCDNIYEIAKELNAGDRLILQREPANEHDALAIKILDKNGNMLGYVPRANNEVIAHLMDIGKDFYAVLTPFRPDYEAYERYKDNLHFKMRAQIFMRE